MSGWQAQRFDDLAAKDQLALVIYNTQYEGLSGIQRKRVDFELDEFEARWAAPSAYFYGTKPYIPTTMRTFVKNRRTGGALSRGKRIAIARKRQRALIRAGLRTAPVTRYRAYGPNWRTGGFLGLELKFLDTAWDQVTMNQSSDGSAGELQPSTGCTNCISVPAQGDGESQRDGRKYTIKSVYFSGAIDVGALSDQADVAEIGGYYFALVLDTQTNGAAINSEDVFINPSTQTVAMLPQPLRNLQNSKRFRILDSKYVRAGGAYSGTDGINTLSLSPQIKPTVTLSWKGNLVCDSIGTTANVSSASDNSLHIIAFKSDGNVTSFSGKCRVRFMG